MPRVLLLHRSEGGAFLEHDLLAFGIEVEPALLTEAEAALAKSDADALVVEAATSLEETKRLLDTSLRPARAPLILLLRIDQIGALDPTWPVDDFLVLPVASEELALRLRRAIWRKTGIDEANTLRSGELIVDLANYKVFVAEQPVTLTFKEFELLRFLMTNRGKVFTREALLNRVWGYEYFGGARTVDVHIRRLRSKIETGATIYIETVRNVGYRFPAD
jgi:DNA-binding response OmpR family regulator